MRITSAPGSVESGVGLDQSGEIAAALQQASRALQSAKDENEPETVAAALIGLARVRFRMGQYQAASALAQEALMLEASSLPAQVDAWQILANCAAETGYLALAEGHYWRAADLAREIGYLRGRMAALHGLAAAVYIPRGQFELSLAADMEARSIALEQDRQEWLIYPLTTIAMAYQLTARPIDAQAALDELHPLVSTGSIIHGYYLCISANLSIDEGDEQTARDLLGQVRSIAEATAEPWLNVTVRLGMGRSHNLAGRFSDAHLWADDALAYATRIGYRHEQGKALIERGRAAWLCGDLLAAEADLGAAVEILHSLEAGFDLAHARLLLAAFLHQQGNEAAASMWQDAGLAILAGGYAFILDQERALAFPLIAAHLNSHEPALATMSATLLKHLQSVPPGPLSIVTLGRFEVWQGRRCIARSSLRRRRAGDLLALLILNPTHTYHTDQIIEDLWPDKSSIAAQTALHQATSSVRRILETDLPDKFPSRYLEVDEGRITLHLPPGSRVDCEMFEEHCKRNKYEAALELYGGELLPGHRYSDWTFAPRERLSALHQRALLATADVRLTDGRFQEALDLCHRLLDLEPWHEGAVLLGMRACLALKDVAGARRLYLTLEENLRQDLDTAPQEDLQAFYHSLTPKTP